MTMRRRACLSGLAASLALWTGAALADGGPPAQSVTALVGFPAGGSADLVLRQLVAGMQAAYPNGLVVQNKPGGGGTAAIGMLVHAKPDGSTFAIAPNANLAIGPQVNALPYKTPDDYVPVINVVRFSPVVVVRAESPYKSGADLLAAARAHPGTVSIGYPGVATVSQLAVASLQKAAGVTFNGVPFLGWGQAAPSLMGGHVDAMVAQPGEVQAQLQSKQIRALATFSAERQGALKDVPTWKELGDDVVMAASYSLIVPRDTPDEARRYLHDAARKAMAQPAFLAFLDSTGVAAAYADGPTTKQQLWDEYRRTTAMLGSLGLLAK